MGFNTVGNNNKECEHLMNIIRSYHPINYTEKSAVFQYSEYRRVRKLIKNGKFSKTNIFYYQPGYTFFNNRTCYKEKYNLFRYLLSKFMKICRRLINFKNIPNRRQTFHKNINSTHYIRSH